MPSIKWLVFWGALAYGLLIPGVAQQSCPSVTATTTATDEALDARLQVLAIERTATAMRRQFPYAELFTSGLAEALGPLPQTAFAWVRDNTRWLPYDGALRGADGVMSDRLGSSLDRALLLASLLQHQGHKVRLVRAPLSADDYAELMQYWRSQPLVYSAAEQHLTTPELDELARVTGVTSAQVKQSFAQQQHDSRNYRQSLLQTISTQQQSLLELLSHTTLPSVSLQPVKYHWWVQWQGSQGWRDLDPALPTQTFGQTWLTHRQNLDFFLPEELPDSAQHWLTIQVVAEQQAQGQLHEHVALEVKLPVHQLAADQLRVGLTPSSQPNLTEAYAGNLDAAQLQTELLEQTQWLPYVARGEERIMQQVILADGSVQDPKTSAVTSFNANKVTLALGALDEVRSTSPVAQQPVALTAVYLRINLAAAEQQPRHFERVVMDILSAEQRARRDYETPVSLVNERRRAAQLLSSWKLLVQSYRFSPLHQPYWTMKDVLQHRSVLQGFAYVKNTGDLTMTAALHERINERQSDLDHLAVQRFMMSPFITDLAIVEPNLLAVVQHADYLDKFVFEQGYDIIHNAVRVVTDHAKPEEVVLGQGVVDTLFEARLSDGETLQQGHNTALDFQHALQQGARWKVLRQPDELAQLNSQPDKEQLALLQQQMANQDWLIVPENAPSSALTWWRYTPTTGQLLGVDNQGRGGFVEWAINLMSQMDNASSAVEMAATIVGCVAQEKTHDSVCCVVTATAKDVVSSKINGTLLAKAKAAWIEPFSRYKHSFLPLYFMEGELDDQIGNFTGDLYDHVEKKAMEGICKH